MVNEAFTAQLEQFFIKPQYTDLLSKVIIDTYSNLCQSKDNYSEIVKEIDQLNDKVKRARELLLTGDLDGVNYKSIKSESEFKIEISEIKLSDVVNNQKKYIAIEPIVIPPVECLVAITTMYFKSGTYEKRELIGSIYPEKFTFEDLQHEPLRQAIYIYSFIYFINSQLHSKKKKGKRP